MKKILAIILSVFFIISGGVTNALAKQFDNLYIFKDNALDLSNTIELGSLSEDVINLLPEDARKYMLDNSDKLVASVVTIHIVSTKDKDNQVIVASKKYDLSDKEEIELLKNDLDFLEKDDFSTFEKISITPLKRDDHSYIITGLNVIKLSSPQNKFELELQGYWDWKTTMLVSRYDRIGLGWSADTHLLSSTAFGNRYYDGKSISLSRIINNNIRNNYDTHGVLWKHNSDYQSYGNVIARISGNSGIDIKCWLDYIAPGGPSSDEHWFINVFNLIFDHFNIPVINYRFQTNIELYV
ncbi:hypothetical protein [Neofamilia massiliensis]|uniref:hypothetical protein n=1 Tax=Neofamilia massiliensis TaxID=1673724 RepID=UPI0006BB6939|nr:hypothetical protein [Neofamilia massiliensis]